MKIFTRAKHVSCDKTGDNILETRSGLIDTVHEIELVIITDIARKEIISASASIIRAPHTICAGAAQQAAKLAGLKIDGEKISVRIREMTGGSRGCSHITDLALEAVKAIKQSFYALTPGSRDERIRAFSSDLNGTCHAYSHSVEEIIKSSSPPNVIIDRRAR